MRSARSLRRAFAAIVATILLATGAAVTLTPAVSGAGVIAPFPAGSYTFKVVSGSLGFGALAAVFPENRPPECSDGLDNDNYKQEDGVTDMVPPTDHLIDFPADPGCASAADDSELVTGLQPYVNITWNGTMTAAGAITIPTANVLFPPVYLYGDGVGGSGAFTNVVTVRTIASQNATGTLNPVTGALTLNLRLRFKLEGGSGLTALGNSCFIGGTANNGILGPNPMITGTTTPPASPPVGWTPMTGSPFNPVTNRVTAVANSFPITGATGCGLLGLGNSTINDLGGLPIAAGGAFASFTMSISPALLPANVAALTASPTLGRAPLPVHLDASASTSLAGITSYEFDCDGDGTVDVTSPTPGADCTLNDPGTYTPSVTTVDVDGALSTATTQVVAVPNEPPAVGDIEASTHAGVPVDVTATGTDPEGDDITYSVTDAPLHGTVTGTGPTFTYTPNPTYVGDDTFTVTGDDGHGGTDVATVTVHLLNTAPTANDASVSGLAEAPIPVILTGFDADGDPLTFAVLDGPTSGTLTGTAPNLTYTGNDGFVGSDSFTFTVSDGLGGTATGTISLGVGNTDPVANDAEVSGHAGQLIALTLSGSDADGQAVSFAIASPPSHGTLSGTAPAVTYTPTPGYAGDDSFTFTVTDDVTVSAPATVTIHLLNGAPAANDASAATVTGVAVPVTVSGSDPDSDPIVLTTSAPAHGTLSGSVPNLTYTPAPGYAGPDSFTVTATDPFGATGTGTVTITVSPIATHLVVGPATVTPKLLTVHIGDPSATLLDANDNPVAGKTITFKSGSTVLCTGVTNSAGKATCAGTSVPGLLANLLSLGYDASFAGTPAYLASSGHGPLLTLLGLRLF